MNLNEQIDFSAITKKTWARGQIFKIFCGIMIFGICLFLISLLVLGLDRWKYLFYIYINPQDSFMDFFNPIVWAGADTLAKAYQNSYNLYPPIVVTISGALGSGLGLIERRELHNFGFLNHTPALILLGSFFFTSLSSFFALIWQKIKGNIKTKLLFCILILFSAPFLGWVERANYVIFAVIGSLFFVMYFDSSKKYLKHLALFALAVAINIKIYPAALGLLLLKEKQFKDIVYLGIYTVLLFVIFMMFVGGVDSIFLLAKNLKINTQFVIKRGYGYAFNLTSTLKMLTCILSGQEFPILNKIFSLLSILILPVGAVAAYFIKSKWKTLAILCLLMILVPQISYNYVLLFMLIPLIYFLNEKEYYNFKDLMYLSLFCIIFMLNIPMEAPLVMPPAIFPILTDNFCERLACLVMFIMLCHEGLKCCRESNYGFKRIPNKKQ